ncbi:MAG: hypothetical protein ACRC0E_09190 [Soonwooa sp.]
MRTILYSEINKERCNAAALGLFNASVDAGNNVGDSDDENVNIEKGFYIRDTLVRPDDFNNLSNHDKREILKLKKEFEELGYIDVRTTMGPDQWSRVSKKQQKIIETKMLQAFRIEDKVKQLKKSFSVRKTEKQNALKKKYEGRMLQIDNQIKWMESVNKKQLSSKRQNSTKTAYNIIINEKASIEKLLKKISK